MFTLYNLICNCGLILLIVFTEVEDAKSSPDSTPKKDKPAKDEVAKVTRPQGRLADT